MRSKSTQDGAQDGPRSLQDGSKIFLDRFFLPLQLSLRFCIVLGAVSVAIWHPKWCPRGESKLGVGPVGVHPRRSWKRLGSVLLSSCRSGCFFGRLGVVWGSFLGAPGVVLVLFRHFNSSIQPINSSTRGPSALSYPARRTARLNPPPPEGSERV